LNRVATALIADMNAGGKETVETFETFETIWKFVTMI
jgi:hypothetical protein